MYTARWQSALFVWFGWILVATFLHLGPEVFPNLLKQAVMNGTGLSLSCIDHVQDRLLTSAAASESTPQQPINSVDSNNDEEIQSLTQQLLDMKMLLAQLKEENQQLKSIPSSTFDDQSSGISQTTAQSVRVIGQQGEDSLGHQQLLIAIGKTAGVTGGEFVLSGDGVLIDAGLKEQISADQLVTFGRALFGRTVRVGAWTTLVQPLTDPEFRTAVKLVRSTSSGPVMGARGILQGTGTDCIIQEVNGTEPVAVGDLVYTDSVISPTSVPIYCGRVVQASIGPNDPHWTVQIEPAFRSTSLPQELTVMRTSLTLQE